MADQVPQEVLDAVNLQYNTKQAETQRALDLLRQQLGQDVQTQQGYGQIGDTKLQDIYKQLSGQLEDVNSRTGDLYNRGGQALQDIYGQAEQGQNEAFQGILGSLQNNANQLGLGAALDDPVAKLKALIAKSQGNLASSKANSLAGNQSFGTNMGSVALKAIGDSAREGAGRRTDLVNQVLSNIAGLQRGAQSGETGLLGSLQDIARERGEALKLGTDQYNTHKEELAREDAQKQEEWQHQLEMLSRNQNFDVDQFTRQADLQKVLQERGIEADQASQMASIAAGQYTSKGGGGRSSNPLVDEKNLLDIALKEKSLNKQGKGREGLNQYYSSASGGKGVSPELRKIIENSIRNANSQRSKDYAHSGTTGDKVPSEYDYALNYVHSRSDKKGHSYYGDLDSRQRAALVKALDIYYGR